MLAGPAAARQLDYWTQQLAGVQPLELATDRPRPAVQSLAGAKIERVIDARTVTRVREVAKANGATPYVTYLAAFVALLARYSRQQDFAVGSITSGRPRTDLEPLIGLFVNTFALRVAPDLSGSFSQLLAHVRDVVAGAMSNQDVPFEQIVERVQPPRDRSRSPIFQVAFQLLDGLSAEPALPGLDVTRVVAGKETSKFELTLILRTRPDGALAAEAGPDDHRRRLDAEATAEPPGPRNAADVSGRRPGGLRRRTPHARPPRTRPRDDALE